MERLSPVPDREPTLPNPAAPAALRSLAYGALAILVAGAGYVHFGHSLATLVPALAAPAVAASNASVAASRVKDLVEVGFAPAMPDEEAVRQLNLSQADAASLLADLRRHRVRLVRMPLFDAAAVAPDGGTGLPAIEVSSGGYTRTVQLGRQPVSTLLPIDRVGTVAFRSLGRVDAQIGVVTLNGPQQLPDLTVGTVMAVGVIAQ